MENSVQSYDESIYSRSKKLLAAISLAVVLILTLLLTIFIAVWLHSFSDSEFRDYIRSFGAAGWLVFLGLQVLQVFIALIPGELLETAAGFAFGPWIGTLLCYLGVGLASCVVFFLTRRFGIKMAEIFFSRKKLEDLRFLNSEKKRNGLIFLLFFIPGTPKDLLTYFAGLTNIKLSTFLTISMLARLPSVLSSTFGGDFLGSGNYLGAIWLYGITGAVSLLGLFLYNSYIHRKRMDGNIEATH